LGLAQPIAPTFISSTQPGKKYTLWKDKKYNHSTAPLLEIPTKLRLDGVETAKEIHYWGHYPVADLEFETDAPIGVGLRAWSPFLPGALVESMLPGVVLEVRVRNTAGRNQKGTLAFSFPGPRPALGLRKQAATSLSESRRVLASLLESQSNQSWRPTQLG
jgi:uncharacterized protein (DUF608 family)